MRVMLGSKLGTSVRAACGFALFLASGACRGRATPDWREADRDPEGRLVFFLPSTGDVPGLRLVGAPSFYDRGNLYDHIDGAAEAYLARGFRGAAVAYYAIEEAGDVEAQVDIYDMGEADNASWIYESERPGRATPTAIGAAGYQGQGAINFRQGPYYVKLVAFRASPLVEQPLSRLAREIARRAADAASGSP